MKITSIVLFFLFVQLSLLVPVSYSREFAGSMSGRMAEKKEIRIENHQNFIENVKEKREEAKEEFKEKREEFKEKIQGIKDERRKAIVERIDARLSSINTNATDRMTKVLEKLNEILSKIKDKTSTASESGKDVTSVNSAIASAETAIATAQAAVSAQAGKEYIANITDETTLGEAISTVVKQLRADLKATHQTVVDARKAVRNAAVELAKINKPSPTVSE